MGTNEKRRRALYRETVILIVALLAVLCGGYYFFEARGGSNLLRGAFESEGKVGDTLRLEIAVREQELRKGLMFRKSMPADTGMLFVM